MAKIVCISKYPPIEGGIAARTFWLARALANRGHEVHVVTDRSGVVKEYSHSEQSAASDPKNIFVYRPQGDIPWHIPNDSHRGIELLDLAVKVIRDIEADIIDTGYLVPYGIIGFLASKITGVPYVLRHGGSDIQKFLKVGIFGHLIEEAFREASLTITDFYSLTAIEKHTKRIIVLPPYIPDPSFFSPLSGSRSGRAVLALIGKANYYWRHKGWHRAVEVLKRFESNFKLLVVSQGLGLGDFKKYVTENFHGEVEWRPFVHPLSMPDLLNTVEGVFALTDDAPFPAYSNIVAEALYCGTTVIVDSPDVIRFYENAGAKLANFSEKLLWMEEFINKDVPHTVEYPRQGCEVRVNDFTATADFERYIDENEKALLSVQNRCSRRAT